MRLDKFLKVSRLIKRRTVANDVCDSARVFVNNNPANKVKIAITPLIKIAVKKITTLYPIIFQKCLSSYLMLFPKAENGFELFATTLPVKCVNKVSLQELRAIDKNDKITSPTRALNIVSAIKI